MGNLEPSERAMAAMRSSAIKRRLVAPLAISCGSMISSTAANPTAKVVAMAPWKGFRGRRHKRSDNFLRPPPKARGRHRKSVVQGKSVAARVDLGGRRNFNQKYNRHHHHH